MQSSPGVTKVPKSPFLREGRITEDKIIQSHKWKGPEGLEVTVPADLYSISESSWFLEERLTLWFYDSVT